MPKTVVVVVAVALLCAGVARASTPVVVDREALHEQLRQVEQHLRYVSEQLAANPNLPAEWQQWLKNEMQATHQQIDAMEAMLRQAPPAGMVVAPPPPGGLDGPPPPPRPIDEVALNGLLAQISGEDFSSGKMRVVREAARVQFFTAAQAGRILPLFEFEGDRLKALEALAPKLLDRQNGFALLAAFEFEGSKKRAERILGR